MNSCCGADCEKCQLFSNQCKGCINSKGCPFGKKCFIYNYIDIGGIESFEELKKQLIKEVNDLNIDGMPKINELYALNGSYVNLEYIIDGNKIKFLDDNNIYLGNQVKPLYDSNSDICFGIICNMEFILICTYEKDGQNSELLMFKKR